MEDLIKKEITKLEREAKVNKVITDALKLGVSESLEAKVADLQSHSMIRTRFYRIKGAYGKCFLTKLDGNNVTVTRIEDEEVR